MKEKIEKAREMDKKLGKRKLSKPELGEKEVIKPGKQVPKSHEEVGKLGELKVRARETREAESKPAKKFLEAYKEGKITLSKGLAASKVKTGLIDRREFARELARKSQKNNFKNIDKDLAEKKLKERAKYDSVYKDSLNKLKKGEIEDVREAYASAELKEMCSGELEAPGYNEALEKYEKGELSALDALGSTWKSTEYFRNYKEFLDNVGISTSKEEMEKATSIRDRQVSEASEKELKELERKKKKINAEKEDEWKVEEY